MFLVVFSIIFIHIVNITKLVFFLPSLQIKNRVSYPTLEKYVTNYPYFIYVGAIGDDIRNIKPLNYLSQNPKSKVHHHPLQLSMVLHGGLRLLSSLNNSDIRDEPSTHSPLFFSTWMCYRQVYECVPVFHLFLYILSSFLDGLLSPFYYLACFLYRDEVGQF